MLKRSLVLSALFVALSGSSIVHAATITNTFLTSSNGTNTALYHGDTIQFEVTAGTLVYAAVIFSALTVAVVGLWLSSFPTAHYHRWIERRAQAQTAAS